MKILGIESSCDDTSIALLDCSSKGCFILEEKTASQIDIHKKYGGVVPEIAGRMHAEKIIPLIEEVLKNRSKPDVIALVPGPGLITGLLVGLQAGKTLSYLWKKPLVGINHLEGHIYSVELNGKAKIKYPAVCLIASGGHTAIILIKKPGKYRWLGTTRDDAAGECFDKTAKLLDLPYPGGPRISQLAEKGNEKKIKFPRPMINDKNYDFSFAGLKTSALYWLQKNKLDKKITKEDFCASFEKAAVDVLVKKIIRAAKNYKVKNIVLGGGVSANKKLREVLTQEMKKELPNMPLLVPEKKYCMDNGAMIAMAAYYQAKRKKFTKWDKITADPNLKL